MVDGDFVRAAAIVLIAGLVFRALHIRDAVAFLAIAAAAWLLSAAFRNLGTTLQILGYVGLCCAAYAFGAIVLGVR